MNRRAETRRCLAAAAAACIVAFVTPAAASAAPAHARIIDPAGDVPYSFDDQADVTAIDVAWTDLLVVQVTYAAPPPSPDLSLLVSSAARSELDPDVDMCDPDMADSFTVQADADGATFRDPYIEGTLTAPPVWAGATVTYTFSSPTLVRKYNTNGSDPFACVDGSAQEDWFYGAFDGKRIKLTAQTAEEGVGRELGRRYGTTAQASMKVRCLARGKRRATPEFVAMRWCGFQAPVSRRTVAIGQMSIMLIAGVPETSDVFVKKFPRGARECGTTDFSGRWLLAPFPAHFGGASMSVWAKRTGCRTARRVARYAAAGKRRRGFRCRTTRTAHEYLAERCTARGGRIVWYETGA
jgi:hypothetical protein